MLVLIVYPGLSVQLYRTIRQCLIIEHLNRYVLTSPILTKFDLIILLKTKTYQTHQRRLSESQFNAKLAANSNPDSSNLKILHLLSYWSHKTFRSFKYRLQGSLAYKHEKTYFKYHWRVQSLPFCLSLPNCCVKYNYPVFEWSFLYVWYIRIIHSHNVPSLVSNELHSAFLLQEPWQCFQQFNQVQSSFLRETAK